MRPVVLVPGLGFGGIELLVLRNRLRRAGFDAYIFYYWPWNYSIDEYARRLDDYLQNTRQEDVDFVAHSLGGLVVARFCTSGLRNRPCTVVTLGTPHMGCEAANRFRKLPGGRWLLGRALRTALKELPIRFHSTARFGTLAGSLNIGLGRLLGIAGPNDSIVRVDEAHHPDALDTVTVQVSHAAMLISRQVAVQVCNFLIHGAFEHSADTPVN